MLSIEVPGGEFYNEETEMFCSLKPQRLTLEHSLVSIAKWESRHKKAFLSREQMTADEAIDYIRCMTITQNVDPLVYTRLTAENFNQINTYMNDPMTATTFRKMPTKASSRQVVTAEIIYYWMISYNIPMECQKWHFNRLMTLIEVFDRKNSPPKKMSKSEIMAQNKALNEERRRKLNTKG